MNLFEMNIEAIDLTKKLTINNKTNVYQVYRIPLDLLYYNDQNDRIATWLSQYKDEKGIKSIDKTNIEDYNNIIQKFIAESNPERIKKTQLNIKLVGQREPGVILKDGRIICGKTSKLLGASAAALLNALKEAGVVDSGGAGVLKILEGFLSALEGNPVAANQESNNETKYVLFDKVEDNEDDEFGYCTEFVMRLLPEVEGKIPYNQEQLREFLESVGVSVVLVNDEDLVKVHVHTYKPGDVFNFAQQYGEFITIKVENMDEQHERLEKKPERKKLAIVTVAVGDGLTKLFKQLRADIVISGGQTMNPSIEDFVKAISKLNPESVIILPNNSNIVMSAKQAADILNKKGINTKIVPTTSIQQGISACMGFNPDLDIEENLIEMFAATKRVVCGQITTAVRDSKSNGITIKSGDYLAIREKKIVSASVDILDVAKSLVDSMMTYDAEIVTIIAGLDANEELVKGLEDYIYDTYSHVEVEIQQGDQPVYNLLLAVE